MIRIGETQWLATSSIEAVFVRDNSLLIISKARDYIVKKEYIVAVCSSLNLPYAEIQGLIIRQGEQNVLKPEETGSAS